MFLRRVLCANRSALLKCHPFSCSCCSARFFSSAIKVKRPSTGKPEPHANLIKALDSELSHQRSLIEGDEQIQPLPEIVSDYQDLLEGSKWNITDSAGLSTVELSRQLEHGQSLKIRFDVRNVIEGVEEPFEDQEFEDDAITSEDKENIDFNEEHIFPLEVELVTADGKKLILDCEVNASSEESPIMVTNATITDPSVQAHEAKGQYAYGGPQYEQLDDGLREAMDTYANKLVNPELIQFISDYSFSKEATQYGAWLENVKHVIKNE